LPLTPKGEIAGVSEFYKLNNVLIKNNIISACLLSYSPFRGLGGSF